MRIKTQTANGLTYLENFCLAERKNGVQLDVDLIQPYDHKAPVSVVIGLEAVRASDGIRVTYDMNRDGYVIAQPTKLCWTSDDPECDEGWKEVAFIQSWALEAEQEANERALIQSPTTTEST